MSPENQGGTVVQEPAAGAVKTDPKSAQQPGGEDYAGMQRALNEMREGKKMPPYLVERGIKSVDDLEAILEKAAEEKPAVKPAATGDDKVPPMPLSVQFGDETEYQTAMQNWADGLVKRAADVAERRASGVVTERDRITEQEALDEAAKQLPEALQADGLGRLLVEALSVAQSGEAPATPRIVAEATERLQKAFAAVKEAEIKALADQAKANAGREAPNLGAGGPAPSSAKDDEVPPAGSSPEVIEAWLIKRLERSRASG